VVERPEDGSLGPKTSGMKAPASERIEAVVTAVGSVVHGCVRLRWLGKQAFLEGSPQTVHRPAAR